jgi:hypothetical protein
MVGSNTVSQADKLNGADSHGSHGKVLGGIWDRIPLFWRFQLVGWLAFTIFSSPSKWVMLETIPTSVLVPLYRDGLGFLITIGMREICRRCYSEKIPKVAHGTSKNRIPIVHAMSDRPDFRNRKGLVPRRTDGHQMFRHRYLTVIKEYLGSFFPIRVNKSTFLVRNPESIRHLLLASAPIATLHQ